MSLTLVHVSLDIILILLKPSTVFVTDLGCDLRGGVAVLKARGEHGLNLEPRSNYCPRHPAYKASTHVLDTRAKLC